MHPVCILGAGSWGTAQAILLSLSGHKVTMWGREQDGIAQMKLTGENRQYLPGVAIPKSVHITSDIYEAVKPAKMIILAVPAQTVRQVLTSIAPIIPAGALIINTSKGLEIEKGMAPMK
jgi:glycerol-3-phosphate dehydrogenase (NAD(P)+)